MVYPLRTPIDQLGSYIEQHSHDDFDAYFLGSYVGSRKTAEQARALIQEERMKALRHPLPPIDTTPEQDATHLLELIDRLMQRLDAGDKHEHLADSFRRTLTHTALHGAKEQIARALQSLSARGRADESIDKAA